MENNDNQLVQSEIKFLESMTELNCIKQDFNEND